MIEGGWLFLLWSLSLKLVHGCEVIPDRVLMINRGELFISSNALIFEEVSFICYGLDVMVLVWST